MTVHGRDSEIASITEDAYLYGLQQVIFYGPYWLLVDGSYDMPRVVPAGE